MQEQLNSLCELVMRHARGPSTQTVIPRVAIGVRTETTMPVMSIYKPMVCLVLQGAKEVRIGDQCLRYDPSNYFITSLDLPARGSVVQASRNHPYAAMSLGLDMEGLASLVAQFAPPPDASASGFAINPMTPQLLNAWERLLGLLDQPQDVEVLAPLHEREILYRLLQGPHGGVLRQIATADGRMARVRSAISWIREHYAQTLRIGDLATLAGMSPAAFHRHFKDATALSPLQYQKSLRLQHARQLLVADRDASQAGFAVGYESASQFSREYARLFGTPPGRDAARLRAGANAFDETGAPP